MIDPAIRKPVHELTPSDLKACPVWHHVMADDETGPGGEQLVAPRPDLARRAWPGDTIVRARFVTARGRQREGYAYATFDGELPNADPIVIVRGKRVRFWWGLARPTDDELTEQLVLLGGPDSFPVRWEFAVPIVDGPAGGAIPGFRGLARNGRRVVSLPERPGPLRRLVRRLSAPTG